MDEGIDAAWSEVDSQRFIDFGRYFVPDRAEQIQAIGDLLPSGEGALRVIELCCGEGLLAEALLARAPGCTVHGFDGSPAMLAQAMARLEPFGERFEATHFDLGASDWRGDVPLADAIVSSLAIHHLDGEGKAALYRDLFTLLKPGGVLVIADVIAPADGRAAALAAESWDRVVREQALALDGHLDAFRFFEREGWNIFRVPDPAMDKPSGLFEQLQWLKAAGFEAVDVYWMKAGHAIFGGAKPR